MWWIDIINQWELKKTQSNHNYWSEQKLTMIINQWELKLETGNLLKAREMRVTKSWLVLISHLIANCFCLKQKLAIKSMAPIGKEAMNSLVWFFCCKETRQTFRTTWRCFSLHFNAMIFDFFIDIFQCRGEIVIIIEPLFLAGSFNFGTKAEDDWE